MARTWSVGYNTVVNETVGDENVILADDVSFQQGMDILLTAVQDAANQENDPTGYETLIADIQDIYHDNGIMCDPDMWEDEDFYGPDDTTWFIVEN